MNKKFLLVLIGLFLGFAGFVAISHLCVDYRSGYAYKGEITVPEGALAPRTDGTPVTHATLVGIGLMATPESRDYSDLAGIVDPGFSRDRAYLGRSPRLGKRLRCIKVYYLTGKQRDTVSYTLQIGF